MRRRRKTPTPIPEPTAYKEPVLGIIYKDEHDIVKTAILPFGPNYNKRESYKENFEDALDSICESIGGFWLDNNSVIPAHRIRKVYMITESTPPKSEVVKKSKPIKAKYIDGTAPKQGKINTDKSNQRTNTEGVRISTYGGVKY